jgi:hypothetical protein
MERFQKFLPLLTTIVVTIVVYFINQKSSKLGEEVAQRNAILEKAREAKLAKSILNNSENE